MRRDGWSEGERGERETYRGIETERQRDKETKRRRGGETER